MAKLNAIDWVLLSLSGALAVTFGLIAARMPGWGASPYDIAALKASGIILLASLAGVHGRRLLWAALLLGAVGDMLLVFERWFLAGAIAFLLGHVCYIALFLRSGAAFSAAGRGWRPVAIAALVLAAIALTLALVPMSDPLFVPLSVYTGVLTLMAAVALTLPPARWLAMIGGVLFFVSDGFVAGNLFHPQSDPTLAFVSSFSGWMIYWAAQACLCIGMLSAPPRRVESR